MKYLIPIIILGILSGTFIVYKNFFWKSEYRKGMVAIGDNSFRVDIADDPLKRALGLSGRDALGPDEGMIFTFGSSLTRVFWMQDMRIPIDILWINGSQVVGMEKGALPEPGVPSARLKRYHSPAPVQSVLEIAAGRASELGIQTGDKVSVRFE
ncbi:MAG: DUF192 domain-containing protein [Candidatus Colwellbacteria bacterium]|nr:DUF192 domain-containing protein [Candidatus Colwellbacteria bacterium]